MNINQALNDDFQFMSESLTFLMPLRLFIKRLHFGMKKKHQFNLSNKSNKDLRIINTTTGKAKTLSIEISAEKINTLLAQGIICAADIRCLDVSSKHCLKELCLATCLYNKHSCQQNAQLLGNLTDSTSQIKNHD